MKQEIIKNDNNEKDITVNFGDMFEWLVEYKYKKTKGEIFIYLGYNKCYRLPLDMDIVNEDYNNEDYSIKEWELSLDNIVELIKEGKLKKCEKGTKFIIEQD